jgi:holo-[acyl-carrier protein] synthase
VILGLGIDVVEIGRIARLLEGPPALAGRFLSRCFTPGERAFCEAHRDRAARYAARFAAKEAAVKALGAPRGVSWQDLEVTRAEGRAPTLAISAKAAAAGKRLGVARIHLSITHDGGMAAAVVVLESA